MRFSDSKAGTVVLVASADCFFTRSNWAMWETLKQYDWFRQYRTVYVDLTKQPDRGFFVGKGVSPSEVVRVGADVKLAYNLRLTPQTLVIGDDGKLIGAWSGLLVGESLREVVKAMTSNYAQRRPH